jgi:ABC-type bacteriocin/lantibiotic exporter with double-glycine peptidase domain
MELADCGAACLAMVLAFHGKRVALAEVRDVTGAGRGGVDALGIVQAANQYGLIARGVRADVDELHMLPRASILHWSFNHFVVFERLRPGAVDVVDPQNGPRSIPMAQFRRGYTGVAVTLEPGPAFTTTAHAPESAGNWRYLRPLQRQAGLVSRVLVTSLLLRLFALAAPLLTAVVVDRVVPANDAQRSASSAIWSVCRTDFSSSVRRATLCCGCARTAAYANF